VLDPISAALDPVFPVLAQDFAAIDPVFALLSC